MEGQVGRQAGGQAGECGQEGSVVAVGDPNQVLRHAFPQVHRGFSFRLTHDR
jgi:hypothetical protein